MGWTQTQMLKSQGGQKGTASPLPHPGIQACLVLAILQDDVTFGGRYTVPLHPWGGGKELCWDARVGGRERGAGSKPSGSRAGLSLSQTSCCQSPFRRSHYGASPALSDESVPDASRGTGSQSGPASLQKGPVGKGDTGMEDSSLGGLTERAALGPWETHASFLSHRNRGGHSRDSSEQKTT